MSSDRFDRTVEAYGRLVKWMHEAVAIHNLFCSLGEVPPPAIQRALNCEGLLHVPVSFSRPTEDHDFTPVTIPGERS